MDGCVVPRIRYVCAVCVFVVLLVKKRRRRRWGGKKTWIPFIYIRKNRNECIYFEWLNFLTLLLVWFISSLVFRFLLFFHLMYYYLRVKMAIKTKKKWKEYSGNWFFALIFVCFLDMDLIKLCAIPFSDDKGCFCWCGNPLKLNLLKLFSVWHKFTWKGFRRVHTNRYYLCYNVTDFMNCFLQCGNKIL